MADFTTSPAEGNRGPASAYQTDPVASASQLVTFTNIAGALVSLGLIIGIGIWGYKLLVRDVSGIPVVRAASGEMRVRPEEPGGELARHQGLSVNAVAAEGSAAKPADRLILAPKPIDLEAEDHIIRTALTEAEDDTQTLVAVDDTPVLNPQDVSAALESGNVEELVAQLTAGVAPIGNLDGDAEEVAASVAETVVAEVTAAERQIAALVDAPGVRQSARPRIRPAVRAVVTPASLTQAAPQTEDVAAESLPAGTRLAQLGAFDSPEVARQQWDELMTRFEAYLVDKKRVVQKAQSGGRTFYRLRAMGFEDIADARRFCSALVAENQDCIPVVAR